MSCLTKFEKIAKKLQTGLLMRGRKIYINQSQFYSERRGKMLTHYIVKEKDTSTEKMNELFSSCQIKDVVIFLKDLYNSGE